MHTFTIPVCLSQKGRGIFSSDSAIRNHQQQSSPGMLLSTLPLFHIPQQLKKIKVKKHFQKSRRKKNIENDEIKK